MILPLALFAQLAAHCGPAVHAETLAAVARTESGFNTLAIGDNTAGAAHAPATPAEAIATANALKLCEELSARLGYDTVAATSRGGPRFWRALRRDRLSLTETDQRRALLLPQEIARLTPGEAILIRPGMVPVRARRIRHYADALFAPLVRPPPAVPPIDIPVCLDQGKGFEPIAAEAGPIPAPDARPAARPRRRRRAAAGGAEGTSTGAAASGGLALQPHQADGLLDAILGTEVDLGACGLTDGKAVVAAIIDAVPTAARSEGCGAPGPPPHP